MLEPHERARLLEFLEVSFGLYELKLLALFLGADYGLFSHVQKGPLVLDLLCYCERREQLGLLIAKMMQQRPGDPFFASLLAKLPPALPRKKAQLILSTEYGSHLSRREMEWALAEFFGVPQEQVAIMGMADGPLRLLVSLPYGTTCPQVRLGSHKLCKGKYEVFFVTSLDALEQASQRTWRLIVLNHPPGQRSNALRAAISWKLAAQASEGDVSSSPRGSAVLDRAHSPESRFLPRIPGAALGLALFIFCIAVFGVFAAQHANRRSNTVPQVAFVKQPTTAIELAFRQDENGAPIILGSDSDAASHALITSGSHSRDPLLPLVAQSEIYRNHLVKIPETVGAQMSVAKTATVAVLLSITPSSAVASTPRPTHTPRPTWTPTVTPTAKPRYRLVQQSRICPVTLDPEASGGQVSSGQMRIIVLDQEGEQQPNAELLLRWNEGEDRAVTGLKPEIGVGYADFFVAAGQSYQVVVIGIESDVAQGIVVDECTGRGIEKGQIASWEIVFQLSGMALSE